MSTEETNSELVRSFMETLSTGDLERVRPFFHEHATWQVMAQGIPGAGTHKGRDFIVDEFLAPVRGLFEEGEPKLALDNVIAQGDFVVVECRGFGRFKTGKEYNNVYCWVFEVRDGKIFVLREYMDSYYITTVV